VTPQPGPLRRLARRCLPVPVRKASVRALPLLESHKGVRVASPPARQPDTPPQPAQPIPRHAKAAEATR
jgi:hypothetical protein